MLLKNVGEIHQNKELIELIGYHKIFWSDFGLKWSDFGQILVRLSGENWSESRSDIENV